jgi:hypothetical protein
MYHEHAMYNFFHAHVCSCVNAKNVYQLNYSATYCSSWSIYSTAVKKILPSHDAIRSTLSTQQFGREIVCVYSGRKKIMYISTFLRSFFMSSVLYIRYVHTNDTTIQLQK